MPFVTTKDGVEIFHKDWGPREETDQTEDTKAISVPVLVLHGEDDQVVTIDSAGRMSAKILPTSELKTYPGFPHGMLTTHADVLNPDLLAFVKD